MINKIFDKKYEKNERKTHIESEIDKFLKDYGDKFDTENITKSLKKLRNKFINFDEFNEEYNKFIDNIVKFEYFKSEKEKGSVSSNQKKTTNEKICKRLKRYC